MNREEKKSLLNDAKDYLSFSQLLTLTKWEWFNKKKLDAFFHYLKIGKHAKAAFEDAKNQ